MRRWGILAALPILWLACGPGRPEITLPSVDTNEMEAQVAEKILAAQARVEERPESASALGRLGMVYQAHALDAAAVSCYQQAAALAPGEYRWPYLAAMAQRNLDLEAALGYFAQAVERRPSNAAVFVHYGDLLLQLGRLDQAEDRYRDALDQDPEVSHALYGLAQIALARQNPEAARTHLEEAVRMAPRHGEAQALLARVYSQLGDAERAQKQELLAKVYDDATLPSDPALEEMRSEAVSSRSYTQRGLRLVEAGRFNDAEAAFRKVLEIRPGTARDLANVGAALARQGRHDEAIEFYEQALRVEPEDPYSLNSLAMSRSEQGHIEKAIELLERVVELDVAYAEARYNLGLLEARRGRNQEAIEHYRQALAIDPALSDARNNLGTALAALGERDLAIEEWRQALWLRPNDLNLLYNLNTALVGRAEYNEAIELLKRAFALAPNSSRIAFALAWQLATAPDDTLRNGAEALRLARRVAEAYPDQPGSADVLAAALAEQGEFEEAVQVAEAGLGKAVKTGNLELVQVMSARLDRYRQRQPYRQPTEANKSLDPTVASHI